MALGRSKSSFDFLTPDTFEPQNASEVLLKWKIVIVHKLVDSLEAVERKKKSPSTGSLQQSISDNLNEGLNVDKVSFNITAEDYWKYVDGGRRKGKGIPLKAMDAFLRQHGIGNTKEQKAKASKKINSKVKTKRIRKALKQISLEKRRKQIGFLINRSIKQHGIKPTHFVTSVITPQFRDEIEKSLSEAFKKDIKVYFNFVTPTK